MRPIVVTGQHRPPERFMVLVWGMVIAASYAAGQPVSPQLAAMLPGWGVVGWYAMFGAGGLLGALGLLWPRPEPGRWLERAGMFGAGAPMIIFAVAGLTATRRVSIGFGLAAIWGVACGWRILQINHDLKKIRHAEDGSNGSGMD